MTNGRRLIALAFAVVCPTVSSTPHSDAGFYARVVSVTAGDRFLVLYKGQRICIRLYGIRCPSTDPWAREALYFTRDLANARGVYIRSLGVEWRGRRVARVDFIGGRCLNEELLKAGMARWHRSEAPREKAFARLEAQARASRRGFWADKRAVSVKS